jgi:hypothetical protein
MLSYKKDWGETIDGLDGMLQSGIEEGASETMDRLAELVEV